MVEAWNEQDNAKRDTTGLSNNDRDELKAMLIRAKKLHAEGKWNPLKGQV